MSEIVKPILLDETGQEMVEALNGIWSAKARDRRIAPLEGGELAADTVVEAVGIPKYVDDVSAYAAYGITETGWYVFARATAKDGVAVSTATVITGAAGYIAEHGANYVDLAVRFDVAAQSCKVVIDWDGSSVDTYVFKATDLAIRNLDYRTTFYVYDVSPYVRWEYAFTADATINTTKHYYTETDGVYSPVVLADKYYEHSYALTADATFAEGKTYYTTDGTTYTAAEVTPGEAVPENTYYEDKYTATADTALSASKQYYTESDGVYTLADVIIPAFYTTDGTTYTQATGVFEDGVTYYTKSGAEYTEATVTVGEAIPAYYNHSKIIFEGMARNITYKFDEPIDCPSEFRLPEIEDETHGCWFEIRLRHTGSYSSTLVPPEGVKVATEHTQAETAGLNMIDLHYSYVDGVKLWRFLNTHSTIPTT